MKLSVIMPVYNREVFVGAALRSLLRQRDAAELDIIVVDDVPLGVDTPHDLDRARAILKSR